jgi:hypothetical protein
MWRAMPRSLRITTVFLFVGALFVQVDSLAPVVVAMAVLWPFLVLWSVWRVLTDCSENVGDLASGEEWAYRDGPRAGSAGRDRGVVSVTRPAARTIEQPKAG